MVIARCGAQLRLLHALQIAVDVLQFQTGAAEQVKSGGFDVPRFCLAFRGNAVLKYYARQAALSP